MKNKLNIKRVLCATILIGMFSLGPSALRAEESSDKTGDFSRGAKVWSENCTRCHNMRDPKEFNDELWSPIVTHMRLRAGLTGQEARDVLQFLRQSNTPSGETKTMAPEKKKTSKKSSVSGKNILKGANAVNGKVVFQETCFACHGNDGKGAFPGVPDFTDKDGVLSQSPDVLFKRIMEGFQTPGSPMAMPARGGNDDLTKQDIKDVIEYMKEAYNK
jgi:cytochrome c5